MLRQPMSQTCYPRGSLISLDWRLTKVRPCSWEGSSERTSDVFEEVTVVIFCFVAIDLQVPRVHQDIYQGAQPLHGNTWDVNPLIISVWIL